MKKYFFLLFIICALGACKKELSYNYAFNVNGSAYRGYTYTAVYHFDTAATLQEFAAQFYIGSTTDTNYVEVSFSGNSYITAGTYYSGIVNPGNTVCSFAYNKNHTYYSNVSGIVEILQIDTVSHVLQGNFQFTAKNVANPSDSVIITNGAFSAIKYIIQ